MNTVKFTCAYEDTDFTRTYSFTNVDDDIIGDIPDKIKALNAKLAAGTAGNLPNFFIADDSTPENIHKLKAIIAASNVHLEEFHFVLNPLKAGGV